MQQHTWRHYCDKCEYLGSTGTLDFYICRKGWVRPELGTALVRMGDADSDYLSFQPGYVPDYGPKDAASDYGKWSVAVHNAANALLALHDAPAIEEVP